jgi:peptidoglycan/xylan/chitin deacetylase (PgdA/CDA1 family)
LHPLYKHKLKKSLALLLYGSGIAEHLLRQRTANQCIVLMYHRVMPEQDRKVSLSHSSITLCTETFEKQMGYIANHFTPLSAGELSEHLRTKKAFPAKSILITFDDGWKDNYAHAMPVLKANKIPALIFLSTGFIGQKKSFWQEHLASLLLFAAGQVKSKPRMADEMQALFDKSRVRSLLAVEGTQRRHFISELIQGVKAYEYPEIAARIHRLEEVIKTGSSLYMGAGIGDHEFLSWDEVIEMHHAGIDFGSHGVNHLILDKNGVDIDFELKQSKIDIEARLSAPITAFSYPNGNYDPMIADKVRSHGYDLGFSTEFGYNGPTSNRFTLKRVNVHQDAGSTIPLLLGRILGLW